MRRARVAAVLAAAALLCGCGTTTALTRTVPAAATPAATGWPPALMQVHDPGRVTGAVTGMCTFRAGGQLPDPRCTPGAVDPAVTQGNIGSTICVRGYTATVRPPSRLTTAFKRRIAWPAYGVTMPGELDHLVPLELGGANDAANLWPEIGKIPNPKDHVEGDLHRKVCARLVSLAAAQQAIAADWRIASAELSGHK